MKRSIAAGAVLAAAVAAPTPAGATQGQDCRSVAGSGPGIGIVLGSGPHMGVAGVTLVERGVARSTMGERAPIAITQSWIDEHRLWIDLTDPDAIRDEGRLRVQYAGRGRARHLAGTFVRNGRVYRMRCAES